MQWTGFVQPQYSALYAFALTADDGARLWVDGKLVIDKWTSKTVPWDKSYIVTKPLAAGRKYAIKLEYVEKTGNAQISLWWSCPNQPVRVIIPQSQLYPQ